MAHAESPLESIHIFDPDRKEISQSATAQVMYDSPDAGILECLSIIAGRARGGLNFRDVDGKEMLVAPFDRMLLKQGKGNLFIKHIGPNTTNKQLHELFSVHGEIFSCKIAQDIRGKSKGYGFVQYRNPDDAVKAISALEGSAHEGRVLSVKMYLPVEKRERIDRGFTNLFVKNLPASVITKEELGKLFEAYGVPTSLGFFEHKIGGKSGFYGFVNFASSEIAGRAVTEMNGKEIEGIKLYVAKALNKDQRLRDMLKLQIEMRNKSRKLTLYVKSANNEPLDEAQIRAELAPFGEIRQVSIKKQRVSDTQEINAPIGFAVFASEESAAKVD